MKIKTSELTGAALDWAVAKCEGFDTRNNCVVEFVNTQDSDDVLEFVCMADGEPHAREQVENAYPHCEFLSASWADDYKPSTDWAQGGPIIEREKITVRYYDASWLALMVYENEDSSEALAVEEYGPTPLIAAMRCYVASKLGDEVEVPHGQP